MPYHDAEWLTPEHDVLQLRVLTASPAQLKALLKDCQPPIFAAPELIDTIAIEGEVYVLYDQAADAVLTFTAPSCQPRELSVQDLADLVQQAWTDSEISLHKKVGSYVFGVRSMSGERLEYSLLEGFFTRTQILHAEPLFKSPDEVCHCLHKLGYTQAFLARLLKQPMAYPDSTFDHTASWCETTVKAASGTIRREMRVGSNGGIYMVRYRDRIEPQCPIHFPITQSKILIEIKTGDGIQSFGGVLRQINRYRARLGVDKAILICEGLTAAEVQAFRHQGVSVYPAEDLLHVS